MTAPAPPPRTFCVVVADTAQARVLLLDAEAAGAAELVEIASITNPMLRARHVELRDHQRRDVERHFAAEIAEEAAAVFTYYPACELVLVAPLVMLGMLRAAIAKKLGTDRPIRIRELARDLTRASVPALHDQLADAGVVPERRS